MSAHALDADQQITSMVVILTPCRHACQGPEYACSLLHHWHQPTCCSLRMRHVSAHTQATVGSNAHANIITPSLWQGLLLQYVLQV